MTAGFGWGSALSQITKEAAANSDQLSLSSLDISRHAVLVAGMAPPCGIPDLTFLLRLFKTVVPEMGPLFFAGGGGGCISRNSRLHCDTHIVDTR